MGFFNDLGKKASEAYNVTKEKTTKLSGELKLKGKINECKNKIEDLQLEIGKIIYTEYKNGTKGENDEEISVKCEEISNLEKDIKQAEDDILALKDIKKCVSCNAELSLEMEFCSKCGTKQPKIEKVEVQTETVEDATEVTDVEVTEVKEEIQTSEENKDNENE